MIDVTTVYVSKIERGGQINLKKIISNVNSVKCSNRKNTKWNNNGK